ncbi:MAG TPA: hypothetical protein VK797_14895 [Tepidisphaeraceae bacterium]|jgi:hypothetical protein|nr:hypothetical protein [Tepidisphaeraceae bacterium]
MRGARGVSSLQQSSCIVNAGLGAYLAATGHNSLVNRLLHH